MKKIILLIILFSSYLLSSQTFYWVGGSGNWSDANHWSLISGGITAGVIPDASTNVIFDNKSGSKIITVTASQNIEVNSLHGNNTTLIIDLVGSSLVDLKFNAEVELTQYFRYKIAGKTYLTPSNNAIYQFAHGSSPSDRFSMHNYLHY